MSDIAVVGATTTLTTVASASQVTLGSSITDVATIALATGSTTAPTGTSGLTPAPAATR